MLIRPDRKDRIIFLDVDGVLDSIHFFKSKTYHNQKLHHADDQSNMINRRNLFWVGLLCRMTRAKVVLTSTWKYGWNEDGSVKELGECHSMEMTDKLFRRYGVKVVSITRKGELYPKKSWNLDETSIREWCDRQKPSGLEGCSQRDFTLKYCRGTQIIDWIERNNYNGKYIVIDDDYQDIIFYRDLAERLVVTSYYDEYDGFRFKHFLKGVRLLLWSVKKN